MIAHVQDTIRNIRFDKDLLNNPSFDNSKSQSKHRTTEDWTIVLADWSTKVSSLQQSVLSMNIRVQGLVKGRIGAKAGDPLFLRKQLDRLRIQANS